MKKSGLIIIVLLTTLIIGCDPHEKDIPIINIAKNSFNIPCEGGTFDVIFQTNNEYTVDITKDGSDWIYRTTKKGLVLDAIEFTVEPNFTYSERNATIVIKTTETNLTSDTVYVVQNAGPASVESTGFSKFIFDVNDNPLHLNYTVEFEIHGNSITGRIPHYARPDSIIARFATDGTTVLVGEKEQISGVTANNFRNPVDYTIVYADGHEKTFRVDVTNFTGLPVLFISTENQAPINSRDDYVKGSVYLDGAGIFDDLSASMKIKGRGNSTWGMPKKPYKIKFDTKQSMAGFPADKEWVLLANYADKSAMRNEVAFNISRKTCLEYTPRTQFVEVFINNVYNGTYQLTEQLKISEGRVNVSDDGFLLEVDQLDRLDEDDVYILTDRILLCIKDPDVETGSDKYNWIRDYLNNTENSLYGENFRDPENGYTKYIDAESFADWYLVNEITKNNDAIFFSSCYMNIAPGGKLKMGPVWDFDIALGNINYNDNFNTEGFWIKNSPWIARLFTDPEFVELIRIRYNRIRGIIMSEIIQQINTHANSLRWSVVENNAKWNTLYTYTWPNDAIWGSYDNEIQYLKNWITKRIEWLDVAIPEL
ncbi:MAG: hypothetical protein GXY51_02210 [Bacteroidetes bacterium]|jgi:hypothetical protein|nr:hypothetical protein [Bacteroidota bacterium]